MDWSDKIQEEAMLACGRCCCICHKFCGVGMECHHIDQKAKGGEDTYENCIPLCFDCHAEVGHYNPQHPKGTKFSAAELRAHRDRWYATVAEGKIPGAPNDYEELDRKLYLRLYERLGGSRQMTGFSDHDYGASYREGFDKIMAIASTSLRVRNDDQLFLFRSYTKEPQVEFYDVQMISVFTELKNTIAQYFEDTRCRVWVDYSRKFDVPPEWATSQEPRMQDRINEAVDVMNKASTRVWKAFEQFVKTARFRLKVDHE